MSNESDYPLYSPSGSVPSPLTSSFSFLQDNSLLQSPSMIEYSELTQPSPVYNSPTIPSPYGHSPWNAHPASGPSSGRCHFTPSYSPTVPTAPPHMAGCCPPSHVPQGIAHRLSSSQKQGSKSKGRRKDAPSTKGMSQNPPKEDSSTLNENAQEQEKNAEPKTSSDKLTTTSDKKQRSQAQPTAQQGKQISHCIILSHAHTPSHTATTYVFIEHTFCTVSLTRVTNNRNTQTSKNISGLLSLLKTKY